MVGPNPYRAVQGELWKRVDLVEWNEKKYLAFFDSLLRFTDNQDQKIIITTEALMKLEQDAFSGQYPFLHELVIRIHQLTTDPKATPHKFYNKYTAIIRQVGNYLKLHPSLVSPQMKSVIESHPRLSWITKHYEVKDTKVGIPITVPTKRDAVTSTGELTTNPNPDLMRLETELKIADIAHIAAHSIKPGELRKLPVKDRVKIALAAHKVSSEKKAVPNIGKINQLVINKASREDLESALLDFNKNA